MIDQAIDKGNEINEEKTSIDASAKSAISSLSEGYPNFIQQFGYSAFAYNKDDTITRDDVVSSAFGEGGALDEIGSRYYEADYFEKIKSDEYREVLNIMAEKLNEWITKATIREKFGGSETQLNNAINALIGRKIIIRNPSKKGEYRLQQQGFALWISLFSERKKKARRL